MRIPRLPLIHSFSLLAWLRPPRLHWLWAALLALTGWLVLAPAAQAAGVVTDCTQLGPGPGTLLTALAGGGLVQFGCSGAILVTDAIGINQSTTIDSSGQQVVLQGDGDNRIFVIGNPSLPPDVEIRGLTLQGGNARYHGGGAILSQGSLTLTNSTLMGNSAFNGGAIEHLIGDLTVINSTIVSNTATGDGASGGGGGAMDVYSERDPQVFIINSTIAGNTSTAADGRDGVWVENGAITVINSLLAHNGAGKATAANCTVGPRRDPGGEPQLFVQGANFSSDTSCPNVTAADPQLGALDVYDGLTPVFALAATSPAIDAVPDGSCTVDVDQRGVQRPRPGHPGAAARCDAGPFEYGERFYVNAAADDGLIGYWKFDEGAGSQAVDASGHHLTGLLEGAAFTADHAAVRFSNAGALDTAGGSAQVANTALLNPAREFSLAAWMKAADLTGEQILLSKADAGGPGYVLELKAGRVQAQVWDAAGGSPWVLAANPGAALPGAWVHVAFTWQTGGRMVLYVNGMVAAEAAAGAQPPAAGAAPLRIGAASWDAGALGWRGQVDDVRIYGKALSAAQAATLAAGQGCIRRGGAWTDALPDLTCALNTALAGSDVWVAKGRYLPTRGGDRRAAFALRGGASVLGGFAGGETDVGQRSPLTNVTILSGDIDENDPAGLATGAVTGSNSLHVVTIGSTLTGTTLDGVVVMGGQANGADDSSCGGGVFVSGGALQLRNLVLRGNSASQCGGALYVRAGSLRLLNVTVQGNSAASGGGIYAGQSSLAGVQVLVTGNAAGTDGGGLLLQEGTAQLTNVTIAGNRAGSAGAGIAANGVAAALANSIIWGSGAPLALNGAGLQVDHSLIQDGCPAGAACANLIAGDPLFQTPIDPAAAPTIAGDWRLQRASPAIDAGDNQASIDGVVQGATIDDLPTDLAGGLRLVGVRSRTPMVDLGPLEAPNYLSMLPIAIRR